MRRRQGLIALLLTLALLAGAGYFAYEHRTPKVDPQPLAEYYARLTVRESEPVDPQAVRAGIVAAVGYLKRNTLPSGQFVYLVNMNAQVTVKPSYNMLRHAGAIYALDLANAVVPDPESVAVMERSARFMRECCFAEVDGHGMGLWEPNALTRGSGPPTYKLGGVGLAVVALAGLERVAPGSTSAEEMGQFARFGRYMMKWNGAFHPRYVPSEGGLQRSGDVLYYPGEMVLGWMAMYEQHPSPELMDWSVKGLMNLARERAAEGKAPADHWSLLATADLFRLAERDKVLIPREALINHALQICHTILEDGYAPARFPQMEGALVPGGQVITTAARLEGLLAALTFLPREHSIAAHVESAVHRGVAFVLRAQIKEGTYAGGFPLSIMQLPSEAGVDVRAFNEQATEIRVDHLQHGLSAIARYYQWIGAVNRNSPAG